MRNRITPNTNPFYAVEISEISSQIQKPAKYYSNDWKTNYGRLLRITIREGTHEN